MKYTNAAYDFLLYTIESATLTIESNSKWRHFMPWLHVKWTNFEIISVFYFVWNWNKVISSAEGVLE